MAMSASGSLTALLRQSTLLDHEDVLKAANAVLKKSKNDWDAQHVKAVALLKLDRYEDAVKFLDDVEEDTKNKLVLEKAYALYKLGKWEEAENLACRGSSKRALKHVEAQAVYRLQKFQKAAELYEELGRDGAEVDNEQNDLKINAGATDAQLQWCGSGHLVRRSKPDREDLEAFETAYNAACGSTARGEFTQADILLKRAKDICSSLDELPDEDKEAELLPITAQRIYVLWKLGNFEEAKKLSNQLSISDILDVGSRRVAQNNQLAFSSDQSNPYLAHRLFNLHSPSSRNDLTFDFQSNVLRRNLQVLDLLSLKHASIARATSVYLSQQSLPTISPGVNLISVINAAANAQNRVGKEGLKSILPLLEKRPTDVGLLLTIMQLYMMTNNLGMAISLLDKFMKRLETSTVSKDYDVRFAPGLVGLLVSLLGLQRRKAQIKVELEKAAAHWRGRPNPPAKLLREAGAALLTSATADDTSTASDIFKELMNRDGRDPSATAGFIASNTQNHPENIAPDVRNLTPIPRLIAGIDAAALEEGGVPRLPSTLPVEVGSKRRAEDVSKPAKKRFRKSRLPKSYDPSKPPDPERWLPLRDRSSYRPKGKKGKVKAAALTQGGISTADATDNVEQAGRARLEVVGAGGSTASKGKKKKGKGVKS